MKILEIIDVMQRHMLNARPYFKFSLNSSRHQGVDNRICFHDSSFHGALCSANSKEFSTFRCGFYLSQSRSLKLVLMQLEKKVNGGYDKTGGFSFMTTKKSTKIRFAVTAYR